MKTPNNKLIVKSVIDTVNNVWPVRVFSILLGCFPIQQVVSAPVVPSAITNLPPSLVQNRSTGVIANDPTRASQKQLVKPQFRTGEPSDNLVLPPVPKPVSAADKGSLVLKKIEFIGNTVVSDETLQKVAQPFLNRVLTARDLEELRSLVTAVYVDGGYINSGAIIPSQSAANGALQIKVIEGELTEVRLEGLGHLREAYLRDRLMIGAGSPLNLKNLQNKYQLLLTDPLIEQLNGSLLPGKEPGESILTVKVTRARPYQLYADADNYTTPSIGGYTGRIGGWVDNLSGFGEHFDAEFMATGGALGVNTGVELPLNAYDTRASFRYSNTHSSIIESPGDQLNIKSDVVAYEGGLSQPLYRSPGLNLMAGINFAVRESKSSLLGVPYSFTEGLPFGEGTTQATVLRLWQQISQQGANNAFVARSTFNKGLDALGATIQTGGMLPSGEFFSWLGQTQYLHRVMDNGAQIVFRGAVQVAANPLLPIERFSVGGVYSVRGYRENFYVTDNGFNTGLDFRYPLFGGEQGAKHSLFLIPFMDYGGAWNNPSESNLNPRLNSLHSVGLGFNWHYKLVNTEFYWAHDIADVKHPWKDIQDDGVHFKVSFFAF
ncbi:MAG: BamA/TamA family outer membrane protein [Methylococcales bacterium]|nr:BamA/TamA family outer membrane protein [Methylococcales bacterium]